VRVDHRHPLISILFLIALAIKYWWVVLIAVIVIGWAYLIMKTAPSPKASQNTQVARLIRLIGRARLASERCGRLHHLLRAAHAPAQPRQR
jgi:hypothetical protein